MLIPLEDRTLRLDDYRGVALDRQLEKARELAAGLKGLRIVNVNSTADGGGVAEILRSLVPLMRDVGLDAQWMVMPGNDPFFQTTKKLHNMLQGAEGDLSAEEISGYIAQNWELSKGIQNQGITADIWVMHDPQTMPLAAFMPQDQPRMWICHIDTTAPNPTAAGALLPWLAAYPLMVFSLPQYVLPGVDPRLTRVAPPAIDAMLQKNTRPDLAAAKSIVAGLGMDPERPLIAQVARFDPWKDPWGVIDAYRLVKKDRPEAQLALLGVIAAKDDPEAMPIYEEVVRHAGGDPDIHLFIDGDVVGEKEVAAVQTASDVVLQKSIREGFGLSVTEALWKGAPVIGGNCGGIRIQIEDGESGFLVDNVEQCAQRILSLLDNQPLAGEMGQAGQNRVRDRFLMPWLMTDYLGFFHELLSGRGNLSPDFVAGANGRHGPEGVL